MWFDLLIRFVIGGIAVSLFALLGDLFKPKSFAGLFGAAPSIALGSLWLAITEHGGSYAAIEGKSMVVGAIAFFIYSQLTSRLLLHYKFPAILVTMMALSVWFLIAFALWLLLLNGPS